LKTLLKSVKKLLTSANVSNPKTFREIFLVGKLIHIFVEKAIMQTCCFMQETLMLHLEGGKENTGNEA